MGFFSYVNLRLIANIQTAVIKESLRLGHGVVTPLPRLIGPTDAEILGTTIPAGVTLLYLHFNLSIYNVSPSTDGRVDGRTNPTFQPRNLPRSGLLHPRAMDERRTHGFR